MKRLASLFLLALLIVPPAMAEGSLVYADHVAEDLRTLVPEHQFDAIVTTLEASRVDFGTATILRVASSPCGRSLADLVRAYDAGPAVPAALNAVIAGLHDPPPAYGIVNPWKAASTDAELLHLMVLTFVDWCVFLPQISGDQDNALDFIQHFAWFYYLNEAARDFVQGRNPLIPNQPLPAGRKFTEDFSDQRGAFMSSPASTRYIEQWIRDPRIEISDYVGQKAEDYDSFNAFFARKIITDPVTKTIPSRPATMPLSEYPNRDYIVVAPTDCIMNPLTQVLVDDQDVVRRSIDNPLQYDTVLDIKGIPISLARLLKGVPEELREPFVGGTGLSCVLMPNTYHHFHAPVNGTVVHAEVLDRFGTYGYSDWPNWVPVDGNVGRLGTDFSQFEVFERGVIVIRVRYANVPHAVERGEPAELTGYVASIPVGLDTIGSVVIRDEVKPGLEVKRGYTELGNFYYGGSLNILLFSKGLATGAVQVRMGNQITLYDIGTSPPVLEDGAAEE